ncbi:hypothetical protein K7432_001685 [Basidiobolus ranarum]|uniref:Pentatricopeptide repeat-containing protein n=1 Tax=Basidiobolus ranarum TaxID=34480 RepID=A0ABR2W939_9FUNG
MTSTTKQLTKWLCLSTRINISTGALKQHILKGFPSLLLLGRQHLQFSPRNLSTLPHVLLEGPQVDVSTTKEALRDLRKGLKLNNVELTWTAFQSLKYQKLDKNYLSLILRLLLKEDKNSPRFSSKYQELLLYIERHELQFNTLRDFTTLISCHAALGNWRLAIEKYSLAESTCGKEMNVAFFTKMIHIFSKLSVSKVLEIKNDMESKGILLNCHTFNALLKTSKIHRDSTSLRRFYQEMMDSGISPDVVTYNTLISAYSKLDDISKVNQIYMEMRDRKVWPDRITFNTLIKAFANKSEIDRAMELYRIMQRRGVVPDAVTYNSLIDTFMRQKNYDASMGIYKSMIKRGVQPTVVTYTILINGFIKNSDFTRVNQLYGEMSKCGVTPNVITYSTLINGFIQRDQIHMANLIYQDMLKRQIYPDTVVFTNLIHGYVRNCKMTKAMKIFRDMIHLNCPPSIVTYSILIDGFAKSYDMKQAIDLYKTLLTTDLRPTAITLNTLIFGYSKVRNVQGAFEIFEEFPKYNLKADVVTYNILMETCFRSNRVDKGFKLYQELLEKGIQPSTFTYAVLMNHYNFTGQTQKLIDLWEHAKSRYPKKELTALVSVLIDSCGFNRDLSSLEITWESLNKEGIPLNENNYNSYLEALCRHKAFPRAIEVFRKLGDHGVQPSVKTCKVLIHSLRANRRFGDLLQVYHYLEDSYPSLFQLINPLPPKQETVDDGTYAYLESILGQRDG